MRRPEAAAIALLALGAGPLCASGADEWAPIEPGHALEFPADHGAHFGTRSEWWYLTGHLEDDAGRRFGFQFTVFRQGIDPSEPRPGDSPLRARHVLAAHLVVTDVGAGRTRFAERLAREGTPLARAVEGELDLVLLDWTLAREAGDRLVLAAEDPPSGIGLELELTPRKPLVLHGERGVSVKGSERGNASVYTSWTRLAVTGRLTLTGEARPVRGTAWFDHEFGSSVLGADVVGWDWFGLQLDDGRELMLFRLRRRDGTVAPASAGTLVLADGTPRPLHAGDFRVETLATWTSPRTRATYPARWRLFVEPAELELPAELDLEVRPLVADAELVTTKTTGVTYWEGPVQVSGGASGRGYAELTGYAHPMSGRL